MTCMAAQEMNGVCGRLLDNLGKLAYMYTPGMQEEYPASKATLIFPFTKDQSDSANRVQENRPQLSTQLIKTSNFIGSP